MTLETIALVIAAFGIVTLGLAHTILGEKGVVQPIIKRMDWSGTKEGADFLNGTVRFAWHITTISWVGLAVILLTPIFGFSEDRSFVPLVVAATSVVNAVFDFAYTRGRHLAWVVFLLIAAACAWPYL